MTDEQIVNTKKYLKYGIDCDIFQEPVTSYARTALWAFEEINRQKSELAELNNLSQECMRKTDRFMITEAKSLFPLRTTENCSHLSELMQKAPAVQ